MLRLKLSKNTHKTSTSCKFQFVCADHPEAGGADRDRTGDPLLAKQVLSQLSYSPVLVDTSEAHGEGANVVGLGRVELPTSALSGLRSNQLSYRPM